MPGAWFPRDDSPKHRIKTATDEWLISSEQDSIFPRFNSTRRQQALWVQVQDDNVSALRQRTRYVHGARSGKNNAPKKILFFNLASSGEVNEYLNN